MKIELTRTGWTETIITVHHIKLCRAMMTVDVWNSFNIKQPAIGRKRLKCNRCKMPWSEIPGDQYVNICMMEKEANQCICDKCKSEIDQNLILK